MLEGKGVLLSLPDAAVVPMPMGVATQIEEYYTPEEVGKRLKFHPDTIKRMMQDETEGVIEWGNKITTPLKKRYVSPRYSASAVQRLIDRLQGRKKEDRK
jgi:hypothetical protein